MVSFNIQWGIAMMIKKTSIKLLVSFVIYFSAFSSIYGQNQKNAWKVAIIRTIPHYAIEIEDSLKDNLKKLGYIEGKNLTYLPTQIVKARVEDFAETAMMVKKLLKEKPNVIATIGTQASVPTWQIVKETEVPMVFAGVTYPIEGKLIEAFGQPTGKNITGISYAIPAKNRVELIRTMFPDVNKYRKIAFIYSGQVLQDFTYMKDLKSLEKETNWEFIYTDYFDYAQNNPSYKLLIKKLKKSKPDLAFGWYSLNDLGGDSINFTSLLKEFGKPIVSITSNMTEKGAIGGVLTDHYALGTEQATMIHQIIKGEAADNIPPIEPSEYVINLNLAKAKELGVTFDSKLIEAAKKIVR